MKIAVFKETRPNETRVALTPQVAQQYIKQGHEVLIETDAGLTSFFSNQAYADAGATVTEKANLVSADIFLKVNQPTDDEIALIPQGKILVSFLYAAHNRDLAEKVAAKGISCFAMDAIPRISRAQNMDALSSQSNLAGYKAVLMGANAMGKIFPMLMTAAGTVAPSKVLIFGVGVAGLQAIATAKRLGAVVEATDVRPETKEQVESLGGKFVMVEGGDTVKTEGGYAKEVSEDYLRRQKETILKHLSQADLVITTALVMGKKAPVLITEEMVKAMKFGSVIVDMAVEQGGNCEVSELDKIATKHGVKIIGQSNIPALLPQNASDLYAKNIYNLLTHLATSEGMKWEMEEEITAGTLVVHEGKVLK